MRRSLLAATLLLAACAQVGPGDRVGRAVAGMERLRGVRFAIDARSVASGARSDGDLALGYHATGELVPPDRLRLALTEPVPATLVIVGSRAWRDGRPVPPAPLRTLAHPQALLEQAREPGTASASFVGLGFARGNLTMRYRIDRRERGVMEVELGLLDDLIRRQSFTVTEAVAPDGSGLASVKTSYVVEYWDFGLPLDIGEPN